MRRYVDWNFPLKRPHTGLMLGNAKTGLLAWGEGRLLRITLGRADLWDHRGGMADWTSKQNFKSIRACLEANDAKGIKEIFACATENKPGLPSRPSVIPVGRFDFDLGEGVELKRARLDLKKACAEIVCLSKGKEETLKLSMAMDSETALLELPEGIKASVVRVPVWDILKEQLSKISFKAPELFEGKGSCGWIQELPADPGIGTLCKKDGSRYWIVNGRGENAEELKKSCVQLANDAAKGGAEKFKKSLDSWWKAFWKDVPDVSLPNARIEELYCYGLYKFACFTNPTGVPASLQGPWIEEYQLPPWSSDYHFNINVQMCYWPAYKANRLKHLMPIFELVWSWRDKLRANAKAFVGIDDGYMLPHAVDDHCVCMGSFWTGTIDHACAAWMAQMMFSYCKFSGDEAFLKDVAFPFMKGVMRVYEEMMEKDGDKLSLPVSVSPEYRGAEMNAWGRNASFQLAAVHRLCEDLQEAATTLGEAQAPAWQAIREGLPKASFIGKKGEERIALWEGTDLEESHRHHSHMAAICPFESIDIDAPEWKGVVDRTVRHWTKMGMGAWTGWCMPWASMIHSRLGNGSMSELILEIWERVFTNEGHGTLHDCGVYGLSVMGGPSSFIGSSGRKEVMQMDAGMGALTAIQDMLLHCRGGVQRVMRGVPPSWRDCSFEGMPCEGGFKIGAVRKDWKICEVQVESLAGGKIALENPWGSAKASVRLSNGKGLELSGETLKLELPKGAKACIKEL